LLSDQGACLPRETTAMAVKDGRLTLVLGRTLETGHVLLAGQSNHARSVSSPLLSVTGQPVDAPERVVINSNRNSFHVVYSHMNADE
jgi:hypothetical protein